MFDSVSGIHTVMHMSQAQDSKSRFGKIAADYAEKLGNGTDTARRAGETARKYANRLAQAYLTKAGAWVDLTK